MQNGKLKRQQMSTQIIVNRQMQTISKRTCVAASCPWVFNAALTNTVGIAATVKKTRKEKKSLWVAESNAEGTILTGKKARMSHELKGAFATERTLGPWNFLSLTTTVLRCCLGKEK